MPGALAAFAACLPAPLYKGGRISRRFWLGGAQVAEARADVGTCVAVLPGPDLLVGADPFSRFSVTAKATPNGSNLPCNGTGTAKAGNSAVTRRTSSGD